MDYDEHWDNEVVADNDESIALIEADIAESKALLVKLSLNDDSFLRELGL
jgi:hypothetical protein